MPRSPLSYGFDNSLSRPELFVLGQNSDRTLPPLSELIMSAAISGADVESAIVQWREDYPVALYRNMLDAEMIK